MITDVIHEKGTGRINEDAVSLNGNLFGVFDGATSLTRNIYENDKQADFYFAHSPGHVYGKQGTSAVSCPQGKYRNL